MSHISKWCRNINKVSHFSWKRSKSINWKKKNGCVIVNGDVPGINEGVSLLCEHSSIPMLRLKEKKTLLFEEEVMYIMKLLNEYKVSNIYILGGLDEVRTGYNIHKYIIIR